MTRTAVSTAKPTNHPLRMKQSWPLLLLSALFVCTACHERQVPRSPLDNILYDAEAASGHDSADVSHLRLLLTMTEDDHESSCDTMRFYLDARGRPAYTVTKLYGKSYFRRYHYTDSSFRVREGAVGTVEYKLNNGLIVSRTELRTGRSTGFVYDGGRHLLRIGNGEEWEWEMDKVTAIKSLAPDGSQVSAHVRYDSMAPATQMGFIELLSWQWGRRDLIPFMALGYFGELPVGAAYQLSYSRLLFESYQTEYDERGRLTRGKSLNRHIDRKYKWE